MEDVERKPRKSVAFSESNTELDGNGEITTTNGSSGYKNSAEAHTRGKRLHPSPSEFTADPTYGR